MGLGGEVLQEQGVHRSFRDSDILPRNSSLMF
jgi:hypothetical protein